ncbi:MAG: hypothetical protein HF973_06485, partial [Chloroflexi bacterium]|nr:hypothetical protein [Chloroflexota bacterium]
MNQSDVWQPWGFLLAAAAAGVLLVRLPLPWAVGLVGGTAVFLLVVIYPVLGLALALLAAPLGAWESAAFGSSLLDSGQFFLLLTMAVWLGRGLSRRRLMIPHTFLNIPVAIFLLVTAVSLLNAPSLPFGLREWLKWAEIALIMLMVVDLRLPASSSPHLLTPSPLHRVTLSPPHPLIFLIILLLAGFAQALIGIWQFGRGDGPAHFLVLGRFYRAYGTFEQPNPFGGYMNLTALLALGVAVGLITAVWQRWRQGKAFSWRLAGALLAVGLVAVVTSLALIFSWSRGAWLSFGAGTAVLVLFWPKKLWQGVLLLAVGGMLFLGGVRAGLVPVSVTERITSFSQDLRFGDVRGEDINDANYAVLERLAHWQAAVDMARENLWLGVGFGNYEPAYADYALLNWPYPLGHAHNYYLNLVAEVGVVGLLAYLVLWTAVFWQTIRLLRRLDWPVRGIALGLLAVWVAISVHHLVDKLYVNNIYIHLGVMLGLLQLLEIGDWRL